MLTSGHVEEWERQPCLKHVVRHFGRVERGFERKGLPFGVAEAPSRPFTLLFELAHRLVEEAGVAAIAFHPRSAAVAHKGVPDYALVARLVDSLPAPVILTGGLDNAGQVREAFAVTGAAAVMLARGALGNPWLFAQLVGGRERGPSTAEVVAELHWTIECAVEHLGERRATGYLRKFYPWYLAQLELDSAAAKRLQRSLQAAETLVGVRHLLERCREPTAIAV